MAHWRDSARKVKLWFIDYRAFFPLLFFLLHIRVWTFILATMVVILFAIIEHFGFTLIVFLRFLRAFFAGPIKIAQPRWRR